MPRAIEIRVDPITKGVIIDTNFPNREVNGATWEPQLFRLGWDTPEEIWDAMHEAVPTLICNCIRLWDREAGFLLWAEYEIDQIIETALWESATSAPLPTGYLQDQLRRITWFNERSLPS